MWVFGYGSLICDSEWAAALGCVRDAKAQVPGYRRAFIKASVRNWGSKECPCPTLNLIKSESAHCRGMAFEFPDDREQEILAYLTKREGNDFALDKLPTQLESGDEIAAIVPVYNGNNLIKAEVIEDVAKMVLQANGKSGRCFDYLKCVAEQLRHLGIDDPAVSELWRIVIQHSGKPPAI